MTVWLRSTSSTMKDAATLATRGEPHGTVVVAEQQTAGIGRHGHAWHSEFGGGLYMSIILRVDLPPEVLPVLTMALGLAVQRSVNELAGVNCDLRWPNDLILNEKKVAGTIVQAANDALIAGIGVNVNQLAFPPALKAIATSLRLETGREHDKDALLDRITAESLACTSLLAEEGKAAIFRQFAASSSYVLGKSVEVQTPGRTFSGVTAGLDENGFLLVQTAAGMETVLTGGVRPASSGGGKKERSGVSGVS